MSENTKIEWCDHTFNPWEGCQKVGPGCDHCYAETRNARFGGGQAPNWGPGAPRRRTSAGNWTKPLRWEAKAAEFWVKHGRRQRVFCASLADVFDNEVPAQWRRDLFNLILSTPSLDWLLLTKRIGNAARMIDEVLPDNMKALPAGHPLAWPWPNVWIGTTVTSQAEADRDIPKLLKVPVSVKFLSMEPLLGPVDLERACDIAEQEICTGTWKMMADPIRCAAALRSGSVAMLDWVIVGGESGCGARPMHADWVRSIRDQCEDVGVPFLFKQWGEHTTHDVDPAGFADHLPCIDIEGRECALSRGEDTRANGDPWWFLPPWPGRGTWGPDGIPPGVVEVRRPGKKAAGRLLDGVEHNDFPGCAS